MGITDEQAHDHGFRAEGQWVRDQRGQLRERCRYGKWTHIDGWSESVVEYIRTLEQTVA